MLQSVVWNLLVLQSLDVAGLSLPVCPRVTTILVLSCSGYSLLQIPDQHGAGLHYGVNTGHVLYPTDHWLMLRYLSDVLLLLNTLQITGTHW